jgi:hypothetical protein
MRVIVAVILAGVLLYAGYWFAASRAVQAQIDQVLALSGPISAQDVQVSGFPYRFDLRGRDVALRSGGGRIAWRAPDVTVTALSYRPHHMIGFVTGQQALVWDGLDMALDAESTRASLVLTPQTDLAIARANLVLDAPVLQGAGLTHRADTLRAALRGTGTALDVAVEGSALGLDPALTGWLDPTGALPPLVAQVGLDAALTLDVPLSFAGPRAVVQGIDLRALSLDWGDLGVVASGKLTRDGPATFGGQISLRVTGWKLVLDALGRSGVIAPEMMGMAGQMAASMTDPGSGVLTLPLAVAGSRVALGPFVLGQLPPF